MKRTWLFILFILPAILCTVHSSCKYLTCADESKENDIVDDIEDGAVTGEDAETLYESETKSTSSPDADTFLLFTQPLYEIGQQLDLQGGKPVEFLIGFQNKGQFDFVVETVEASFRYPMDFNYHIQNFSSVTYNRGVKPGSEATVSYSFIPSDQFSGRPFGLNIALNYRDEYGAPFSQSVFNETVLISEIDEGLDGETFFLYLLLAGIIVLLLVIGQQYLLGSSGKRKRAGGKKSLETGTAHESSIEYEWLPQQTLRALQKSPPNIKTLRMPPKSDQQISLKRSQSPKQRKVKRTVGDD